VDESSPLLYQACLTNETLQRLNLNFYIASSRPKGRPSFTVTLADAIIASIRHAPRHGPTINTHELEEIAFVFTKIDIENLASPTSAADDWTTATA